ncbi:hypothetical protein AX15_005878 [Amanita polypyramis BW_CC]|nr:hypothetical protein AX15_005878 [Amanita polypyramis BW_CC]
MRTKPLPADHVDEKIAVHSRDYAHRPLPVVPTPVAPAPTYPTIPLLTQSQSYQASAQAPRRSRTVSQGHPPRSILKKPKEQPGAPPVQVTGGQAHHRRHPPSHAPHSWPPTTHSSYPGHHTGHHPSTRNRVSHQQLSHQPGYYGSSNGMFLFYQLSRVPTDTWEAPPIDRRRSTNTHTYGSARYQPSDSPVSDEDDIVRLMQIKTSNYIPAYIKTEPMKPEAIALNDFLRPIKHERHGRHNRGVFFDIAFDPRENDGARIKISEGARVQSMPYENLDQSACTHDLLTEMTIYHADARYAMWPIRVRRKEGIRVRDVYAAIYDSFHKTVRSEDGIPEGDRRNAEPHRDARCRQASGLYEYNWRQGLLRVDVLRSHTIFAGIEQDGKHYRLYLKSYMER